MMQRVGGARLLERIETLGRVGCVPDGGRTRLALSDADREARDLVTGWMREARLDVHIDRIGNLYGISGGGHLRDAVMMGSHIDTVKNAGALDGCYGVIAGIEIAEAMLNGGHRLGRPFAVAAFTNEEGVRFAPDLMGSRVVAGSLALDVALASSDCAGVTVADALDSIGYAGDVEPSSCRPARYLELHIEQGPVLHAKGERIAVVEGVYGARWLRVQVAGQANHAGTTPMELRKDAAMAVAAMMTAIDTMARSGLVDVATVGRLDLHPNMTNVVAGRAEFTVDLRDASEQKLASVEADLRGRLDVIALGHGVEVSVSNISSVAPVGFDRVLTDGIATMLHREGYTPRRMRSGATHDAQALAAACRATMLFVPSERGISHHPAESTDPADLILGAESALRIVTDWCREGMGIHPVSEGG